MVVTVPFLGDHQGQPSQLTVDSPVCGQFLSGQTGGGTMLLVDAIRRSCGVYQDHGLIKMLYSRPQKAKFSSFACRHKILTFTIQ